MFVGSSFGDMGFYPANAPFGGYLTPLRLFSTRVLCSGQSSIFPALTGTVHYADATWTRGGCGIAFLSFDSADNPCNGLTHLS